tara:strand:- start:81 stop:515 length:435 start_codon:yes stop_codon:yes gene_type:complete
MYIYILLFLTSIFTFSCSYDLEKKSQGTNRINLLEIDVKQGITTKKEIISKLGPPSIKNPYANNIHYYISQDLQKNISKKDALITTIILEVTYNKKNLVKSSYRIETKGSDFKINEDIKDNNVVSRTRFNLFREILNNMRRRNN